MIVCFLYFPLLQVRSPLGGPTLTLAPAAVWRRRCFLAQLLRLHGPQVLQRLLHLRHRWERVCHRYGRSRFEPPASSQTSRYSSNIAGKNENDTPRIERAKDKKPHFELTNRKPCFKRANRMLVVCPQVVSGATPPSSPCAPSSVTLSSLWDS